MTRWNLLAAALGTTVGMVLYTFAPAVALIVFAAMVVTALCVSLARKGAAK